MKKLLLLATMLATSTSLLAADATGKDDVAQAAQKLAAAENYSWTTTMVSPQFSPGPSHGKTIKGGYTSVEYTMQDNSIEAVVKDGKGAIKGEDGWQSLDDAAASSGDGGFNPRMMLARRMKNYKTPAMEAQDLLGKTKDMTAADGVCSGDLTTDGAKDYMTFGRRRPGGQAPTVKEAKGSAKFWVKDGTLTKYEYKVQGTINRNGDDVEVSRTVTVEIKDVGTTKITVPDAAKEKMS